MIDNSEEKAPLLNPMETDREMNSTSTVDNIPLGIRSHQPHCHVPEEQIDSHARNRLIIVLILCFIFMIIEILGGILSNSTAVITDAAHMCSDAAGFFISLIAMYLARKKANQRLSFGYVRAEILGALLSVLTVWTATAILVFMAIGRCIDRSFEVKPVEMIIVASCGVVFNIVMFFVLHGNMCNVPVSHHGHSHSSSHISCHGHSHSEQSLIVVDIVTGEQQNLRSNENINVRAAIIHVIGDFVQSIGVLLAAILIKFKPEYKLADPICTFLFSFLVLITTMTIMRDIVLVLMEGVPSHLNYRMILNDLSHIPAVRHVHSLHIWSLSMDKIALSVHIAIDSNQDQYSILNQAQELLRSEYQITRTTIQIELYDEYSINSCQQCSIPDQS